MKEHNPLPSKVVNPLPILEDIIELFKNSWPPVFHGKRLDELTGNLLQWRTIQNRRSCQEIPENCFVKFGMRKVAILRDPFLDWLILDITKHNQDSARRRYER